MKRLLTTLIIGLMFCASAQAVDITKSQGELYDWTLLDDVGATPAMHLETGVHSYTGTLESVLNVVMVNIGAVADAGSVGFKVFVRYGAADDGWREWQDRKADVAVGVSTTLDLEAASAQAVLAVAATAGHDSVGQIGDTYFLHNATLANSELVIWGGVHADADTLTVIDNLVATHAVTTTKLWAVVSQWHVLLPNGCDEAKVLFYNQDADANYACRVDYANQDAIE